MAGQKSYKGVNQVSDNNIRQALIELWNELHNTNAAKDALSTSSDAAADLIAELQDRVDRLTKQVTIIGAGGGISTPSSVGGGGSGGTSGGSGSGTPGGGGGGAGGGNGGGPNQDTHGNHLGEVAQAKADLIAAGYDISGPCGGFAIVTLAAARIVSSDPAVGLLDKPSGNNCNGYAVDIICFNDGQIYDVLQDSGGANNPQWNFGGTVSTDRYRPPLPPPI